MGEQKLNLVSLETGGVLSIDRVRVKYYKLEISMNCRKNNNTIVLYCTVMFPWIEMRLNKIMTNL